MYRDTMHRWGPGLGIGHLIPWPLYDSGSFNCVFGWPLLAARSSEHVVREPHDKITHTSLNTRTLLITILATSAVAGLRGAARLVGTHIHWQVTPHPSSSAASSWPGTNQLIFLCTHSVYVPKVTIVSSVGRDPQSDRTCGRVYVYGLSFDSAANFSVNVSGYCSQGSSCSK